MYRYETHLHTAIGSACSNFKPEEIVEKYTRWGYAGVFVTEHFLNGNTTVMPYLPWREQISEFCEGYLQVKKVAQGKLDVFFGFEYSYNGTDFLVYGLDENWLLLHREIMDMPVKEFCNFARSEGGFVAQAHPYRLSDYIGHIRLYPDCIDGVETINACRDERTNRLADILASEYSLIKIAGSDIHCFEQNCLAGVEFENKLQSERDFIESLKRGKGKIFTHYEGF